MAWLPMPVLALANAGLREMALQPALGPAIAQPLSGVTLSALLTFYAAIVIRNIIGPAPRWTAWLLGLLWAGLTLAFEYAMIAASQERPLQALAQTLSPSAVAGGNLFAVVALVLFVTPALFTPRRREP